MRYLDGFRCIEPTEPNNALILGTALHTGIEQGVEAAQKQYFGSYPIITDAHVNEWMKLDFLIPLVRSVLPSGEYEVEIKDEDFHGYIDLLAPATVFRRGVVLPDTYDIYDFKYSNATDHYMNSRQLHLYKYFFERCNPGKHIRNLYFVFVPKVAIKQKKTEDLRLFRQRIMYELEQSEIRITQVNYDLQKVMDFLFQIKRITETTTFPMDESWMCNYCEYAEYCKKGWDYMLLPENKRRDLNKVERRTIWIYGAPFCGKTTFANAFPDPLMLNTDGNIKFVDAPYIRIKGDVKVEGRITKRTLAWDNFKAVLDELEKKDNTFRTIVVDLLEDLYEFCRLYMYDKLGIRHESDDSFKAWDMVRSEFLNTLKRLMALDYENIVLISHEDMSKDITKKGGDKVTAIKPNLQDKVAVKVAGMVDIVARIVADGEERTFNFKSNEVIFGGGRLKANVKDIPLDVDELFRVYDAACADLGGLPVTEEKNAPEAEKPVTESVKERQDAPAEQGTPVRTRRTRRRTEAETE